MSERFSPKVKSTPKQKEPPHKKRQLSTSTQSDESMVSMTFTKEEIDLYPVHMILACLQYLHKHCQRLYHSNNTFY